MTQTARILSALAVALAFVLFGAAARAPDPAVGISLEQRQDGDWLVRYELGAAQKRLDLGPSLGGARARDWLVLTDGVALVSEKGRDYLVPSRRGAKLSRIDIAVAPRLNGLAKDYETAAPLGSGVVLYTGHFIPFTDKGRRSDALVDIRPRAGAAVSAFGETRAQFKGWRSPFRHPAFIYVGPAPPRQGAAAIYADPSAPGWIRDELETLLPSLFDWYAKALGAPLDAPPDMFLAMGGAAEAGRLRYHGDALPGQFMIALSGGGWETPDNGARALLRRATAHEAAHLWQSRARPAGADVPDWIHEGGADALANEALNGIGLITPAEAEAARIGARYECERELAGLSLDQAEAAGRWRAVYACGDALAVAAARAENPQGSVAALWRDFVAASADNRGYDLPLFLSLIEAKGGRDVAEGIRRFAFSRYAQPARELAALAREE